ncbi:MAG: NAD kinase [Paludibacteraceae bacterium]|jgi:NAD+ kinase|nr:NAD kinase [Paludibacteraceae bacterium]MEE0912716.1 NAD kinase [Paludibacteraceae bacterium]
MKVIIFGNKCKDRIAIYARQLVNSLLKRNVSIYFEKDFCRFLVEKGIDMAFPHQLLCEGEDFEADMAFSIGGDGTFIKTSAKIGKKNIPIIGINAGRLGFLADIAGDEIEVAVKEILDGKYKIEDRTLLRLYTEEKLYKDFNYALNEIAVMKRDSSSMITIDAWANDVFINSYQADGLLISTSTGSTAYSMSVGGPIVVPQAPNFIITPIAPHSLNVRPIIIPDDWEIKLRVESRNNQFLIALDGRNNIFDSKTHLLIKKAGFTTKVVKRENNDFFDTLRSKLMWGMSER